MIENINQYKEKSMTRVLRYLRKNTIEKTFVSAEEIVSTLKLTKSQVSSCLGFLEHHHLLKIKLLNYRHRTDPRKGYKLNKKGLDFVEQRVFRALSDDEVTLLNLYHRLMNRKNSRLKKIYLNLIQLFHDYGFNDNISDLIEEMGNLVRKVRKFFKYKAEYARNMELTESA